MAFLSVLSRVQVLSCNCVLVIVTSFFFPPLFYCTVAKLEDACRDVIEQSSKHTEEKAVKSWGQAQIHAAAVSPRPIRQQQAVSPRPIRLPQSGEAAQEQPTSVSPRGVSPRGNSSPRLVTPLAPSPRNAEKPPTINMPRNPEAEAMSLEDLEGLFGEPAPVSFESMLQKSPRGGKATK